MKLKLLLICIILFSSCSSLKQDFVSFEFLSYNYFLTGKPGIVELTCYRYSVIDKNGNVIFYQQNRYPTKESSYFKSIVKNELIDSILVATEKQKKHLNNNRDTISLYDGPNLKIKINYLNGKYEIIDFTSDNVLYKYFGAFDNEQILVPINDTMDFFKMRQKLINTVWKRDSLLHLINPPPPLYN